MSGKLRIVEINVKKLFGIYTYTLSQNKDSNFMIFYGDNGAGKTTILSCLYHIFNPEVKSGHRTAIGNIPFLEFNVKLSNGENINLKRTRYNQKKYTISFVSSGRQLEYTWSPEKNGIVRKDNYIVYCKYLEELNLNTLFLTANRQIYDEQDEADFKYRREPPLFFSDDNEELRNFRGDGGITLNQVVEKFHRWIHQKMIALTNEGNISIGEHYLNIIDNITKHRKQTEQSGSIRNRIENLKTKNESFIRYGLSIELFSQKFFTTISKLSNSDWDIVDQILDPYISSLELRLEALSSLQDRLQKLESYLSKFFNNKRIEITIWKGISIKSSNGDELQLQQLSSGEKQMLYLLCRIMTFSNNSSLIIIDEPEISLNIKWQREFLSAVNSIIGDDNIQIIIATHSIEMITPYRGSVVKLISNE